MSKNKPSPRQKEDRNKLSEQSNPEKKTSKPRYRRYDPENLKLAYNEVMERKMSVRKAAMTYGIPLTTLRDRVDGRVNLDQTNSGPDSFIGRDEEGSLAKHIIYMTELGYGYSSQDIRKKAAEMAIFLGKPPKHDTMSEKWLRNFLRRWPNLKKVKERKHTILRAMSSSPQVINRYCDNLEKIFNDNDFHSKPQFIYNVDETCVTTDDSPPMLLCETGQPMNTTTINNGTNATVISCGNALGTALPPYFVFAGKRMDDGLLNDCLPGTQHHMSDNGWSNGIIFKEWMERHFSKYLQGRPGKDEKVLILYDGHLLHVNQPVISWAEDHGIILFVLPAHRSLRTLDLNSFAPLTENYNQECCHYMCENPEKVVTKYDVCRLICRAHTKCFSTENLIFMFRNTGIYPLRRQSLKENIDGQHLTTSCLGEEKEPGSAATDEFLHNSIPVRS